MWGWLVVGGLGGAFGWLAVAGWLCGWLVVAGWLAGGLAGLASSLILKGRSLL